ncbi:MAG: hypothetical protein ACI9H6_000130 [Patiriisocius sp.]|jgi:hypothetical protein
MSRFFLTLEKIAGRVTKKLMQLASVFYWSLYKMRARKICELFLCLILQIKYLRAAQIPAVDPTCPAGRQLVDSNFFATWS